MILPRPYKNSIISDEIKNQLIEDLQIYISVNSFPTCRDFNSSNNLNTFQKYQYYFNAKTLSDVFKKCGFIISDLDAYKFDKHHNDQEMDLSKDDCIKIIFEMQNNQQRPLKYDDFRNPNSDTIGITFIRRYWKTFNNMKKELGLEVIQESMMDKQKPLDEMIEDIKMICYQVKEHEHRNIIVKEDFITYDKGLVYHSYVQVLKKNGIIFRELLKSWGFEILKPGYGLNYIFEDGETVSSIYEYMFSKILRERCISYSRNVNYANFIDNYSGLMNCDYVIKGNKNYYIEIAGMLKDREKRYYEDYIFSRYEKQKYAEKLREKERLMKEQGLNYFIFFPYAYKNKFLDDMNSLIDTIIC